MKKWETIGKLKVQSEIHSASSGQELKVEDLVDLLLKNRGIKTKKEREEFLHPQLSDVTPKTVGIDLKQLKKALVRIKKAIDDKEQIIVFGDYDVDGITGSAILWETLHKLGAKVLPYIPHRVDEGYGLSKTGIINVSEQTPDIKLIITTDNGIMAHEAVAFANEQNIDVIITDHHTVGEKLPDAHAIVHTTKLCGAGVAYLLSKEIKTVILGTSKSEDSRIRIERDSGQARMTKEVDGDVHLELATLGTVADLVPLTGANRAIVKEGLKLLPKTKRLGLLELYKNAGIEKDIFEPYEIGFVIGPRLNASGRIESAMDSLRLICTTNRERAAELAAKLELVNKERQQLLKEAKEHAILGVRAQGLGVRKLLFVSHESYPQGVIGLVAGKLVEEFYRPAIVLSIGEVHSKASARSVSGFNIIEFLRLHEAFFVNAGGHPMAAGFTVETVKLLDLQKALEDKADEILTEDVLTRKLKIDCELPFSAITKKLYEAISQLAPFGIGNSEPVFATKGVIIDEVRIMGKDGSHLKLFLSQRHSGEEQSSDSRIRKNVTAVRDSGQARMTNTFEAIGFGLGHLAAELKVGDAIDVAYTIDENVWNGNTKLQLKIKDLN